MPCHAMVMSMCAAGLMCALAMNCRGESQAEDAESATLEVRIAVPIHQGERRMVAGSDAVPFQVVVVNRSARPVRLWTPQCSFGYAALQFEASDDAGHTWMIQRKEHGFRQNLPDTLTLNGGDMMVLTVTLKPQLWNLGESFPPAGQTQGLRLRAIYQVDTEPMAKQADVWTGRIVSPAERYTVANVQGGADGS
ncbi:MAG: hypothetical protein WC058_07155 [Phycisphaeraceae bacterium]